MVAASGGNKKFPKFYEPNPVLWEHTATFQWQLHVISGAKGIVFILSP